MHFKTSEKSAVNRHIRLINVCRSSVRSILEYAVEVWQNIAECHCDSIESIQKRAFKIIYPDCSYDQTLVLTNEDTLSDGRDGLCKKFMTEVAESREHPLASLCCCLCRSPYLIT